MTLIYPSAHGLVAGLKHEYVEVREEQKFDELLEYYTSAKVCIWLVMLLSSLQNAAQKMLVFVNSRERGRILAERLHTEAHVEGTLG